MPGAYPGLEVVARQAQAAAEATLPPDVKVGILLAFHGDTHEGGVAWVAGVTRESALALVCEWLVRNAPEHAAVMRDALDHHLQGRAGPFDPHA